LEIEPSTIRDELGRLIPPGQCVSVLKEQRSREAIEGEIEALRLAGVQYVAATSRQAALLEGPSACLVIELRNGVRVFHVGKVELDFSAVPAAGIRCVALLAVYNERRYLEACLRHLVAQGFEVLVIDNESDDGSFEIASAWQGRGVLGVERLPRRGVFRLRDQMLRKQELARELDADWILHVDADEFHFGRPGRKLKETLAAIAGAGYDAVNFQEFTFLPSRESPDHDHPDFVVTMRHFYPFRKRLPWGIRAFSRPGRGLDMAGTGGHRSSFPGMRLYPRSLPMRHYQFLSVPHALERYGGMRYDPSELRSGLHGGPKGWRARFRLREFELPSQDVLHSLDHDELEAADPWRDHYLERLHGATAQCAEEGTV
jgi:glycosyltransferase involved in cell wall biosynthesis